MRRALLPPVALLALLVGVAHGDLAAPGPDTLGVRFEIGASTDLSNEIFYEDTTTDNRFRGRQLVDSPEARYAGVAMIALQGTRAGRRERYTLVNDLSLGDLIRRDALSMSWRRELSPSWRLDVAPRVELRQDRSFDRDLQEARATGVARARHALADDETFLELGGRGDFSRSSGASAVILPDRNAGGAFVALERSALLGGDWRVGYSFTARAYPDSIERDHLEHGWEARFRREVGAEGWIALESDGVRRVTVYSAPTSRDNFIEARGAIEAQQRTSDRLALRERAEVEAHRYDLEDSTLYFDYQIARGAAGIRIENLGAASLTVGPRVEALFSRLNPTEAYLEVGGALEYEMLGASALWIVSPAAGWRDYDRNTGGAIGLHSSYAFYELGLIADQALPAGLRVRANGTFRLEYHIDDSQDARSLYFSLDVRRLF